MAVRPRREAGMGGQSYAGLVEQGTLSFDSIPDRVVGICSHRQLF
jgi:hypothetical protein